METRLQCDIMYGQIHEPFGMILSGRSWEAGSGYRYGFNGKEQDPETYGEGNIYDYGFRIYNPRLGKFLSVDPLTKSYAWYTPYQFSGNKPIWKIDLDGLEEAESRANHESPSDPNMVGGKDPDNYNFWPNSTYNLAGGDDVYNVQKNVYDGGENWSCAANSDCTYQAVGGTAYRQGNEFVNRDSYLLVNELTITPVNFVVVMMGNFIRGTGPENYVFPRNGAVSRSLANSEIVKDVIKDWNEANSNAIELEDYCAIPIFSKGEKFGYGDQGASIWNHKGLLNIENFIGSARGISIEVLSNKEVLITVFNITSLVSGDLSKEFTINSDTPQEARDPEMGSKPQPYTNISQTYSFTMSMESVVQ